ncbi:ATP-binding protein [Streptomyces hydrogenans]|uniref:ATP-binding protein n=1 Tax=Streptomyces hydrogenans TaxID=1873719 RepID=UPI0035D7790F
MAAVLTPPGNVTIVHDTPYEIAAFLRPRHTSELPGIGPKTARTLARYGITTVGDIADTPPATLQRILGATPARQAHALAHGTDTRPVVPAASAKSLSTTHRFHHDELDTDRHDRTVLALAENLANACRHARTEVTVTVNCSAAELVLTVHDDGPGIPPADRARVFDRFTRLDEARTRSMGGAGLGLPIARDLATTHGGTLTIEDSPTGALLRARFPVRS